MSGSMLSFIGASLAVLGAIISAFGALRSSEDSRKKSDTLLTRTENLVLSTKELADKNAELSIKSDQLAAKSDQIAAKSDENAELSRQLAALQKTVADYTTGAGSYFYLHLAEFGQSDQRARVRHVGKNPVRDTEVLVWDVSDQIPRVAPRNKFDLNDEKVKRVNITISYPGQVKRLTRNLFAEAPKQDSYSYLVVITGGYGTYQQFIQLVRDGEVWKQAYVVERIPEDGGPSKYVGQYFDEGFPPPGPGVLRPMAGCPFFDGSAQPKPTTTIRTPGS
jgi:hypothetical protein